MQAILDGVVTERMMLPLLLSFSVTVRFVCPIHPTLIARQIHITRIGARATGITLTDHDIDHPALDDRHGSTVCQLVFGVLTDILILMGKTTVRSWRFGSFIGLVPPIAQYLPLRNRSPEYEWDIPLRNGIAQWEG
jgi:hypothetical protein